MKKPIFLLLILITMSGCSMVVHKPNESSYRTLGIAHVQECKYYEKREDNLVIECTKIDTDAFSGWEAIMKGIGDMIVRIFTLGFK